MKLSCDPTIPLLGIYPEKTIIEKDTCTPMFIVTLFTISRSWKQPRCLLTDEWIKKLLYIAQPKKGMKLGHFGDADELRVCHTE